MKIVIDIPEHEYKNIKEYYEKNDIVESTYSYIYHGTPLPKGHGDLIDRDELELDTDWNDYYDGYCGYSEGQVRCAPVVIEADRSDKE